MGYRVKLEAFEGPLDLLLKLIAKQELAITSISVREIIEQFFDYFAKIEFTDVEEGSRFLVLAATLLAIKAQLLLPQPEQEAQIETSFLSQEETSEIAPGYDLYDYQQFREAAATLETYAQNWHLRHKRPPLFLNQNPSRRSQSDREDILRLLQALKDVLARETPPPETFEVKPIPDLGEKMEFILDQLQRKPSGLLFLEFLPSSCSREEIIVTFLALLELVYQGRVKVSQVQAQEIVLALADSEKTPGGKEDAGYFS